MYEVDELDAVFELDHVPPCDPGAPLPVVVADEQRLLLACLINQPDPDWDGTYARSVGPNTSMDSAIVEFIGKRASLFGPPNDEAFDEHPLAARGLHPYAAFRVDQSSWIRRLERMNRVHPYHTPAMYQGLTHYIFAFHDSMFECIAGGLHVDLVPGPLTGAVSEMCRRLYHAR